jgi:hypothetical protein
MLRESAASRRTGAILPCLLLRLDRTVKRLLHAPAFRFQWFWPATAFAALVVVSVIPPLSRAMPVQNHPNWPVAAVDWIEAHGIEGRFFADPNDGAYLTWRLPGRVRCYADTRGFFFPPELIEDCGVVPQLADGWPERLDRVRAKGTDYFLLPTTGPGGALWRRIEPHVPAPLYRDDAVVLLTTEQVVQGLAEQEQQAAVNP